MKKKFNNQIACQKNHNVKKCNNLIARQKNYYVKEEKKHIRACHIHKAVVLLCTKNKLCHVLNKILILQK